MLSGFTMTSIKTVVAIGDPASSISYQLMPNTTGILYGTHHVTLSSGVYHKSHIPFLAGFRFLNQTDINPNDNLLDYTMFYNIEQIPGFHSCITSTEMMINTYLR